MESVPNLPDKNGRKKASIGAILLMQLVGLEYFGHCWH